MKENNIIAIQGIEGSNHHKVVSDFLGKKTPIITCNKFEEVAKAVVNQEADFGLMAIENSIAGSILPNYQLILENKLEIVQEFYLPIAHHLVALPNQDVQDIKVVKSHQMALYQCSRFFSNYPHIQLMEDVDTALPAKQIAENNLHQQAALVPEGTAQIFGLEVIQPNIQNHAFNETRFVLLQQQTTNQNKEANKATLYFTLPHQEGSLAEVLYSMKEAQMNLTKIQSIPLAESAWAYAFIVDLRFDSIEKLNQLTQNLQQKLECISNLGTYKSGRE